MGLLLGAVMIQQQLMQEYLLHLNVRWQRQELMERYIAWVGLALADEVVEELDAIMVLEWGV